MTIASYSSSGIPTPTSGTNNKSYTKILNDNLSISLTYRNSDPDHPNHQRECQLSFHNTSKTRIVINPHEDHENGEHKSDTGADQSGGGWFGGIFRRQQQQQQELKNDDDDQTLKIFLGYVQLFGYIVLNYRFSMDSTTYEFNKRASAGGGSEWWNNVDYLTQYLHTDFEHDENVNLDQAPFLAAPRLIIGGKLAGVGNLIIDTKQNKDVYVDSEEDGSLLHDLIYPFNSKLPPRSTSTITGGGNHSQLSLKELTDSIVPIYTTPQLLLFTDLKIEPETTQTFHFKFPVKDSLPPSYNTRSTGPGCDQGWCSIRYSLIVSIHDQQPHSKKLSKRSVYFPMNVDPGRVGMSGRYIQRKFLQDPIRLDNDWKIEQVDPNTTTTNKMHTSASMIEYKEDPNSETRSAFLQDLTALIDSSLYNMPKMSTSERKKSIVETNEEEREQQSYLDSEDFIPQLPEHLKTQYQLRINKNHELCMISLNRPYFHIGEDIHYIVDIKSGGGNRGNNNTRVIGLITYLEANEIYHCQEGKELRNVYRVTGNMKVNTFASAMIDSCMEHDEKDGGKKGNSCCLVNDHKHIPRSLTPQFQSSFMDLKYFLVFQFNLSEFGDGENGEKKAGKEGEETNGTDGGISEGDGVDKEHLLQDNEKLTMDLLFETNRRYKFDAIGSGNKFKVPIYILP
ncbi:uncharacterized protein J8A68_001818 [[Candida] subhashii]|uniref:Rgp1-domain-containing protein n=1 Tax=[Candida] subhashii TaxID=561895 RepID=A0A8J5QH98_9ASCO|nr:uncharacterized protein J8A68_001818 [[Candida] subhashii]KAG7664656.1 hypothetical protein J8A68_001818 [[Candida] subhashii]